MKILTEFNVMLDTWTIFLIGYDEKSKVWTIGFLCVYLQILNVNSLNK